MKPSIEASIFLTVASPSKSLMLVPVWPESLSS